MEFTMTENGFVTEVEYGTLHISGNEELGFRPFQLLVSSVAVCSGGVLRKILAKQRTPYDDIRIRADVRRNEQGAQEVTHIHMHFIIAGAEIKQEKMEKVLALARKNCSMVQSVQNSIEITESFELI